MKLNPVELSLVAVLVFSAFTACRTAQSPTASADRRYLEVEESEEFKIQTAVYRYLLGLSFWKTQEYSAVFLQGTNREVRAQLRQFPNHIPKIKPSSQADLRPHSTPIDKETGKPAVILTASGSEPEGEVTEAVGSYYAGAMIRSMYFFTLKKVNGQWAIQTVKEVASPGQLSKPPGDEIEK